MFCKSVEKIIFFLVYCNGLKVKCHRKENVTDFQIRLSLCPSPHYTKKRMSEQNLKENESFPVRGCG